MPGLCSGQISECHVVHSFHAIRKSSISVRVSLRYRSHMRRCSRMSQHNKSMRCVSCGPNQCNARQPQLHSLCWRTNRLCACSDTPMHRADVLCGLSCSLRNDCRPMRTVSAGPLLRDCRHRDVHQSGERHDQQRGSHWQDKVPGWILQRTRCSQ